jgi:hypothetical protein
MMNRTFCDSCGNEITEHNEAIGGCISKNRLGTTVTGKGKNKDALMKVELLTSMNGTANAGDFCKYCIIEAFSSLDDRPKIVKS